MNKNNKNPGKELLICDIEIEISEPEKPYVYQFYSVMENFSLLLDPPFENLM